MNLLLRQRNDRPVLVGMNNPYGTDPRYALYPLPRRATGHRLYEMLCDAVPEATMRDYVDRFDRRNLLFGAWSDARAGESAPALWRSLAGRRVCVLGAKLRDLLPVSPPNGWPLGLWLTEYPGATSYAWLPHPSGLNRAYNDPSVWDAASACLGCMYRGEP